MVFYDTGSPLISQKHGATYKYIYTARSLARANVLYVDTWLPDDPSLRDNLKASGGFAQVVRAALPPPRQLFIKPDDDARARNY